MELTEIRCPACDSTNKRNHMTYEVKCDEPRMLYQCDECNKYYAETKGTPIERLRTPISEISRVLNALNEGTGINAATRLFGYAKNTIYLWIERFSGLKETLMLYALCHQFLQLQIEGDEIYTKVGKNKPPMESEGWTIILMDRASRFIWEMKCGKKTESLFLQAMNTLAQVISQTDELSLFTDGERRYGNLLFAICRETFHTGERGRPPFVLPQGVTIRIKNKGDQSHQLGPKRPKYQAPWREHPHTNTEIDDSEIHANHLEAFNSSLRRHLSCYRRRTNMYAKITSALQSRLDLHWLWHNFVNPHFSLRTTPAVSLGILSDSLSWQQLSRIQSVATQSTTR